MTNPIAVAAQALRDAAATVPGVRVFDLGAAVDPPGVVVGAPSLVWETYCPGPTGASFSVWVVAAFSVEQTLDQLWELTPAVAAALDDLPEAAVTGAEPSVFAAGGRDLPCYAITVEVTL